MNTNSSDTLTIAFGGLDCGDRNDLLINVNIRSRAEAVEFISSRMRDNNGFCFATLNLDHVVKLRESSDFLKAYVRHDAVSADGFPIVWLGRMSGVSIYRTTGSDFIRPAVQVASNLNRSVCIVGTTIDSINQAETVLKSEFPNLKIAMKYSPRFGFDPRSDEAAEIVKSIIESESSLCLIALSPPKQEIFADFARGMAPHVGFISIGAGIDFISGKQNRAPKWMQNINLEWLWRLLSEPKRLSARYFKCLQILPHLMMSAARSKDIRVKLRQPYKTTD